MWKPKVTPMSELRPNQMSYPAGDGDNFVQKTSLAADKRVKQKYTIKTAQNMYCNCEWSSF